MLVPVEFSQGVEKPILSKMLVEGSNRRTYAIDRHAGMVSNFTDHLFMFSISLMTASMRTCGLHMHACFVCHIIGGIALMIRNCIEQAVAGVAADGRQAVNKCVNEAHDYKRSARTHVPIHSLGSEADPTWRKYSLFRSSVQISQHKHRKALLAYAAASMASKFRGMFWQSESPLSSICLRCTGMSGETYSASYTNLLEATCVMFGVPRYQQMPAWSMG